MQNVFAVGPPWPVLSHHVNAHTAVGVTRNPLLEVPHPTNLGRTGEECTDPNGESRWSPCLAQPPPLPPVFQEDWLVDAPAKQCKTHALTHAQAAVPPFLFQALWSRL